MPTSLYLLIIINRKTILIIIINLKQTTKDTTNKTITINHHIILITHNISITHHLLHSSMMRVYNINFSLKINSRAITVVVKCSLTITNKTATEGEVIKVIIIDHNYASSIIANMNMNVT